MRKKFVALLLTGAVAVAGVVGLTACGSESGDPPAESLERGEQVTEAQWKAAISATANAKNFTASLYQKNVYSFTPPESASVSAYSGTDESSAKTYADLENNKLYSEFTQTSSENGETPYSYTVKSYAEIDGLTLYSSALTPAAEEWTAESETYGDAEFSELLGEILLTYCLTDKTLAKTENGTLTSVSELYSVFTYQNGIYTAALYTSEYYEQTTVSVSVRSGYVTGMKLELKDADEEEGYSYESVLVFSFGSFSETNLGSIVPNEAVQAVEAIKPAQDGDDDGDVDKDTASGNIYEFDHIYFLIDMDTPEEIENELLASIPEYEEMYAGAIIVFKTNGVVISVEPAMDNNRTVATYTQTENVITLTDHDEETGKTHEITSTLEDGELTTMVEYPVDGTDVTATLVLVYNYKNNKADGYVLEDDDDDEYVVSGNIYEFNRVYFSYDDSVSDEQKKQYESMIPMFEAQQAGALIVFQTNGVYIAVRGQTDYGYDTYTQDGKSVTIGNGETATTATLKKDLVTFSAETDEIPGVTMYMEFIYKNNQADEYGGTGGGDSSQDGDSEEVYNPSVEGLTLFYGGYEIQKNLTEEEAAKLNEFFDGSRICFEDGTARWTFIGGSEYTHPYTQSNSQINLSAFTDIPSPYKVDDALLTDSRLDITIFIGDLGLVTVHYLLK